MIVKDNNISIFIKTKRKELGLTQEDFSLRVGIGLRLIREIEQGKLNISLAKLLLIFDFLGAELIPREKMK